MLGQQEFMETIALMIGEGETFAGRMRAMGEESAVLDATIKGDELVVEVEGDEGAEEFRLRVDVVGNPRLGPVFLFSLTRLLLSGGSVGWSPMAVSYGLDEIVVEGPDWTLTLTAVVDAELFSDVRLDGIVLRG